MDGGAICVLGSAGQYLLTARKKLTTAATGQETEVPDADETARQHMQHKAAEELLDRKGHYPFLVSVGGVSPPERDLIVPEVNETPIGNRNSMCVSTEIPKNLFGAAERWFAINNPAQCVELTDETPKQSGLRPPLEHTVEPQLS